MNKDYASALDDILNLVNDLKGELPNEGINVFPTLNSSVEPIMKKYKITFYEVMIMLRYLTRHEYIFDNASNFKYEILFKGFDFIKEGGFSQQRKNELNQIKYQNWTTFALIFGGVAAGCYYIGIFFHWLSLHFCGCH